MQVKHIYTATLPGKTPAESIAYMARVSNPTNQHSDATASNLIRYLIEHKHWSPFEMLDMCLEVQTSRAISAQIIRHRSFSFQEFSQRYANAPQEFEPIELRLQGNNKQGSGDVVDDMALSAVVNNAVEIAYTVYNKLIKSGVSRETARMVLPLSTSTRLYMKGSVRSWIHYVQVRTHPDTQKEHRDIAEQAKAILTGEFPQLEQYL
jgi:thymidylate synthase (FAD)